MKTSPTTNNKDKKIDTIEVGFERLSGSARALKGLKKTGLSRIQAHDLHEVCLPEFFDTFHLTNNIC
jgi:hypothetical protein